MSTDEQDQLPGASSLIKRLLTGQLPLERETIVFIMASSLDVFMTWIMLYSNNFFESNPLAAFFLNHWGLRGFVYFKMVMTAFVCVLAQIIALKKPASAEFVLKAGTVILGCVVIYSFVLFLRHS